MWDYVGIVRNEQRLGMARRHIDGILAEITGQFHDFRLNPGTWLELRKHSRWLAGTFIRLPLGPLWAQRKNKGTLPPFKPRTLIPTKAPNDRRQLGPCGNQFALLNPKELEIGTKGERRKGNAPLG